MAKRGHIPIRSCVVCRAKRPKRELIRLVLNGDYRVIPDWKQRLPGRGAYVCSSCFTKISMNRQLHRAFRYKAKGLGFDPASQDIHREGDRFIEKGETIWRV